MQSADKLSKYLAQELSLDEERADTLRFGAEVVFSTMLGAVAVGVAAYSLGCLRETLALLAAYAAVRTFAGGAHCSTPWRCAFSTVLVFPALGKSAAELPAYLLGYEPYVLLLITVPSLFLVAKLSPVDNPVNPIEDPRRRQTLKRNAVLTVVTISAILLAAHYLFTAESLVFGGALGLAWSAAVLTGPAHGFMNVIDHILGCCAILRSFGNR